MWKTATLPYYTDPGPLGPSVSHEDADAMVAAAAAVWAVPTSSIAFTQGGMLAEDVSPANVASSGGQIRFPDDVGRGSEDQIPIAVVYDDDGGLIDLLLGEGASDPGGCRQNAVVGDIDDVNRDDGTLRHAVLVLNGRCVGSSPEQLTQMQYQLARAFGRILGLSWSQTNDNVFTAETTVTARQMAYWPVMHPLDVICSEFSYQCMTDPFTLRPDDLNTLALLYPVYQGAVSAGKQGSSDDALYLWGNLTFASGQGMDWVNVVTRRDSGGVSEDWQTVSTTTGFAYQQAMATPASDAAPVNAGTPDPWYEGYFMFRRVPLGGVSDVYFTTEAINPLYTGESAIGPYVRPPATPSGSPVTFVDWSARTNGDGPVGGPVAASMDAAMSCRGGQDGTESAPAKFSPDGWQEGLLCNWGHSSWWTFAASPGHTWTLEAMATDEAGRITASKAQPVFGLWRAGDASGTVPSVAAQPVPFNSLAFGVTQAVVRGANKTRAYRVSITDQFGAGRPDFSYVARVLYAATAAPSAISTSGGKITIVGTGFREGMQVLVNRVQATVVRWTSTEIVANLPSRQAAQAGLGVPVALWLIDPATGATASLPNAFTYVTLPNVLEQVSAPASLLTGIAAEVPLTVRVLASDHTTPVQNAAVSISVPVGAAQLGACPQQATCTLLSGPDGVVQTSVTGAAAGEVQVLFTEIAGGKALLIPLADRDPVRSVRFDEPDHYVAAGAGGTWTRSLTAMQEGVVSAKAPLTWNASAGLQQSAADEITGTNGIGAATFTASTLTAGAVETVTGCAWVSLCATWRVYGVAPTDWVLHPPASFHQSARIADSFGEMDLAITDSSGHALEGAPITIYQRVLAWGAACEEEEKSRCPAVPVLKSSQESLISDALGRFAITPLEVSGIPQVIEIGVSSGSYAFVTLTLTKAP